MTEFASLQDTWSCKSNLLPDNYYPYREMLGKQNCIAENYSCGLNCSTYPKINTTYTQDKIPLMTETYDDGGQYRQQRMLCMGNPDFGKKFVENYQACCRINAYNSLNSTWQVQKPYTL
jgi:hypothetical protein